MKKLNSKVLLAHLQLLTNFEVTNFKDPKAAILALNLLTGSRL
jgi:hypothetical protein